MRQSIWDFWAPRYHTLWVQPVSLGPTREAIVRCLSGLCKTANILDVGCGTGQMYQALRAAFPDVAICYRGIDQSRRMIEVARNQVQGADVCFEVLDADRLEPDDGRHDVIICTHAFPYFRDKPRVMDFFSRSLKENGRLLLAQACTDNTYDRAVLLFVRLTTSKAQYLSQHEILALAEPLLGPPTYEERIGQQWWLPSIRLFAWQKQSGAEPGKESGI